MTDFDDDYGDPERDADIDWNDVIESDGGADDETDNARTLFEPPALCGAR